eukprot:scaffold46975_cov16-Tisochrysis_lutea.AAC.1
MYFANGKGNRGWTTGSKKSPFEMWQQWKTTSSFGGDLQLRKTTCPHLLLLHHPARVAHLAGHFQAREHTRGGGGGAG